MYCVRGSLWMLGRHLQFWHMSENPRNTLPFNPKKSPQALLATTKDLSSTQGKSLHRHIATPTGLWLGWASMFERCRCICYIMYIILLRAGQYNNIPENRRKNKKICKEVKHTTNHNIYPNTWFWTMYTQPSKTYDQHRLVFGCREAN